MRETGRGARRTDRARWRIGVLDSDARSRALVSRLIECDGATVVVDSPLRSDSVALTQGAAVPALAAYRTLIESCFGRQAWTSRVGGAVGGHDLAASL
jgi:hypothetical protein